MEAVLASFRGRAQEGDRWRHLISQEMDHAADLVAARRKSLRVLLAAARAPGVGGGKEQLFPLLISGYRGMKRKHVQAALAQV